LKFHTDDDADNAAWVSEKHLNKRSPLGRRARSAGGSPASSKPKFTRTSRPRSILAAFCNRLKSQIRIEQMFTALRSGIGSDSSHPNHEH
jgi:hypothetical protein